MRTYDVVFFDLDHTLIDTRKQYQLGLAIATREVYGDTVPKDFTDRFLYHHGKLWGQYDRREITMPELRRQRFLRAWADLGVQKSDAEAAHFHEVYEATFETTLFAYEGTHAVLEAMAATHRLGMITNGSPDLQWRKMGIADLQRFFPESTVIISESIGMAKPDPSVYAAACSALGVDPGDALMIGDNYIGDVHGARHFGMDAIWYAPDPRVQDGHVVPQFGEFPVTEPTELLKYLAKLEQAR